MSRILVVEDEAVIRSALRRLLERHGYEVTEAASMEQARTLDDLQSTDLIIADLRLPGAPGTDAIRMLESVPVLIMTSFASVRSAVESMQQGAVDYIAKPFNHDEMLLSVERILEENRMRRQNRALKLDIARAYPVTGMLGSSNAMQQVFVRIDKVAPTDTTVLIIGESGTGKELVARALHEKSARSGAPMITMNCAAIPSNLVESELFGHEKGAFTSADTAREGVVEAADGGTLFLDEIGELPIEAQARLLRVLQDGEIRRVGAARTKRVDVRLVAATHQDLPEMVSDGSFREDLYFRLHVMEIRLPPLRERDGDIRELAEVLLAKSCERLHKPPLSFEAEALAAMQAYSWPGNVRELEHAIERAVILCDGARIGTELLALDGPRNRARGVRNPPAETPADAAAASAGRTHLSLEEYFKAFVEDHQSQMTETELAERLGISRKALWERRQRLGIPRSR
ncbi:MAG: two-component system response regulator CbrB [Gammaproteobacteria bacterium]|nr:MAG: two-component system response regulator CbrB [Gammaproteobacteria bacterium]